MLWVQTQVQTISARPGADFWVRYDGNKLCKQLFDLSRLFERIEKVEVVGESFAAFSEREIKYKRNQDQAITLATDKVLHDIIDTCLIIARMGGDSADDKQKFSELRRGIRAFKGVKRVSMKIFRRSYSASDRKVLNEEEPGQASLLLYTKSD